MFCGKRVVVVLPAYNAEKTLERTCAEIDRQVADEIVLVDDASRDATMEVAARLGLRRFRHPQNRGYGGNQKTCYRVALSLGADIVIMVHPDYQYSPLLIPAMAGMIGSGLYDVVLGSRILGGGALGGGMPLYKYIANRGLTFTQNLLLGTTLSEFHTGYRAFARQVLTALPLEENSDDFVFDAQVLAQVAHLKFRIGEVSCPTRYMPEASSINFRRSVVYGFGCLGVAAKFRLTRMGLLRPAIFDPDGRKVPLDGAAPPEPVPPAASGKP